MKLLNLRIYKADTCGGLLDGLFVPFRSEHVDTGIFDPLCLIGPNGSGKSQLLQVIAEIFQAIFHKYLPSEERGTPNDGLEFEIEYLINEEVDPKTTKRVRIYRRSINKRKPDIIVEIFHDGDWMLAESSEAVSSLLPSKVVGYTSGDNETLSLPFFSSRAGYAKEVSTNALDDAKKSDQIPDPRLLLIDYGTNLEVLVANLLLNPDSVKTKLLSEPNLKSLRSFRCVIQLNHKVPGGRAGVKLTDELEKYIEYLKCCATCYSFDETQKSWILDYFVTSATYEAFGHYWSSALELYGCFHKLAMLNDLIIPKKARDQFQKGVKDRRFALRLPEPFDEQKVFRFERVIFISNKSDQEVDYVSLSDGEHQLAQLLGTAAMVSFPNVLFLLDEPESHFNPRWRVEFIKTLKQLPTTQGVRSEISAVAQQECLITTHSPFVPSDMQRENVLIFNKETKSSQIKIRRPQIQTYGSKFDAILAECFNISPPISALSRDWVEQLLESGTASEIETAISELGDSTARMRLAAKLSQLDKDN
jgi:restriction system-associated AAA family ATPase